MKLLNDNDLYLVSGGGLVSGGDTKSKCEENDSSKTIKKFTWDVVRLVVDGVKFYSGLIMSWNAFVTAIGYGYHEDYDAKESGTPDPNDYRLKNHLMAFIKGSTELK